MINNSCVQGTHAKEEDSSVGVDIIILTNQIHELI
jgi:hypothetical protein